MIRTGRMIQIKKAENDPKKAITFPNPGSKMAVTAQIAVVMIREMILKTTFRFSRLAIDSGVLDASSSLSASPSGREERPEVNIWDSSPGVEGLMDRMDSIVTFSCSHE